MAAKFSLFTVAALPLIPIALACGGDDGGGKIMVRPDGGGGIDSGTFGRLSRDEALAQTAGPSSL